MSQQALEERWLAHLRQAGPLTMSQATLLRVAAQLGTTAVELSNLNRALIRSGQVVREPLSNGAIRVRAKPTQPD
jgi:hypothetical protein